jgi:hypothetical protein
MQSSIEAEIKFPRHLSGSGPDSSSRFSQWSGKKMKVEFLYLDGCPNHLPALERIKEILQEESCGAEVREILVPDVQAARHTKFLGSPTIRVNGLDIEPTARERRDFGLMCRRYSDGIPSYELIRNAVRSALVSEGERHE